MTYVIQCIDKFSSIGYYTGRAGTMWLSDKLSNAFEYQTIEEAARKAKLFNDREINGLRFTALRRWPGGEEIVR